MTLKDLERDLIMRLGRLGIEPDEARREAKLFLESVLKAGQAEIVLMAEEKAKTEWIAQAEAYISRRSDREPPQYILGKTRFMGLEISTGRGVFIPRTDTETLVAAAHSRFKEKGSPLPVRMLEIGVGSGAVIIALLKLIPQSRAVGIDLSRQALELSRTNAVASGVIDRLELVECNFRSLQESGNSPDKDIPAWLADKFDIVVSNPPYIPIADRESLAPEIRHHEPDVALFGWDADGLGFYRCFQNYAPSHLIAPGGIVALECGDGQAEKVAEILSLGGMSAVEIVPDVNGLARVVAAELP